MRPVRGWRTGHSATPAWRAHGRDSGHVLRCGGAGCGRPQGSLETMGDHGRPWGTMGDAGDRGGRYRLLGTLDVLCSLVLSL